MSPRIDLETTVYSHQPPSAQLSRLLDGGQLPVANNCIESQLRVPMSARRAVSRWPARCLTVRQCAGCNSTCAPYTKL